MYLRTLLIVFLVAVVAIFAVLNWSAFMSETTLSVGFTSVQAPLGLVLLIVTALLALVKRSRRVLEQLGRLLRAI